MLRSKIHQKSKPHRIRAGVVFIASSDSGWMTGETLYVTGGLR